MASFDVIFIGGGPAGYVGAIRCAQLGLTTAVVEREGLGGTCVLWGCIPAKALLEAASLAEKMKQAAEFGVTPGEVKLDYGVAMKRSRAVSTQNSKGVEFLFKKNKITWIKGTAKLAGKNAVSVKTRRRQGGEARREEGGRHLHRLAREGAAADRARAQQEDRHLVRRGADAREGAEDDRHRRRRRGRLRVRRRVQRVRLAGHARSRSMPTILPLEDADCSEGGRARVQEAEDRRAHRREDLEREGRQGLRDDDRRSRRREEGAQGRRRARRRRPRAERRGDRPQGGRASSSPIAASSRSTRRWRRARRASTPSATWPARRCSRTRASARASCVAEILAGQHAHLLNYGNIPNATYCHPEVASIGLTEQQCKDKKLDYKVGKFPFSANGRARTSGETEGFVKIIRDAKYGEILGAHIVGAHATELIHELVVARDERVHGRGGRSRDPRAPDAVRGGRRGGAGLAREDDSRLTRDGDGR